MEAEEAEAPAEEAGVEAEEAEVEAEEEEAVLMPGHESVGAVEVVPAYEAAPAHVLVSMGGLISVEEAPAGAAPAGAAPAWPALSLGQRSAKQTSAEEEPALGAAGKRHWLKPVQKPVDRSVLYLQEY